MIAVNCDDRVSIEEFPKLAVIVRAPFVMQKERIKKSKPQFPLIEYLYFHAAVRVGQADSTGQEEPPTQVCEMHEFADCGVLVSSAGNAGLKKNGMVIFSYYWVQAIANFVALLQPLFLDHFPTPDDVSGWDCSHADSPVYWWSFLLVIFAMDIAVTACAFSTEVHPFAYCWPGVVTSKGDKRKFMFVWPMHLIHFLDIVFVIMLSVAILQTCSDDTPNTNWVVVLSALRTVKCFMLLLKLPRVKRVFQAAFRCVDSILPVCKMIVHFSFVKPHDSCHASGSCHVCDHLLRVRMSWLRIVCRLRHRSW